MKKIYQTPDIKTTGLESADCIALSGESSGTFSAQRSWPGDESGLDLSM